MVGCCGHALCYKELQRRYIGVIGRI